MVLDIIKPQEKNEAYSEDISGNTLMEWKFSEYEEYQRGKVWYLSAGAASLALLVYSIFVKNYLLILIVILVDLIILVQTNRKPDRLDFKITELGIYIGNTFHEYKNISKFWIIYNPPLSKTLYLTFKSSIRPQITIPLENKNPLKIRDLLLKNIEEDLDKENESTSEQLRRLLKL